MQLNLKLQIVYVSIYKSVIRLLKVLEGMKYYGC